MSKWLSFLPRKEGHQNLGSHRLVLALREYAARHALNRSLFFHLRLRFDDLRRTGCDGRLLGLLFLAFLLNKSLAALRWVVAGLRLIFLRLRALRALSRDPPWWSRSRSLLRDLDRLFRLLILDGWAASAARLFDDCFGADAAIDLVLLLTHLDPVLFFVLLINLLLLV